jgi:hypothetical protein
LSTSSAELRAPACKAPAALWRPDGVESQRSTLKNAANAAGYWIDRYGSARNAAETAVMQQNNAKRIARDCTMILTVVRAWSDNANPRIRFLLSPDLAALRPNCVGAG